MPMFSNANRIFIFAALFVLCLLIATLFIPARIIWGVPVMLWFWLLGMLVFGGVIRLGVRARDQ